MWVIFFWWATPKPLNLIPLYYWHSFRCAARKCAVRITLKWIRINNYRFRPHHDEITIYSVENALASEVVVYHRSELHSGQCEQCVCRYRSKSHPQNLQYEILWCEQNQCECSDSMHLPHSLLVSFCRSVICLTASSRCRAKTNSAIARKLWPMQMSPKQTASMIAMAMIIGTFWCVLLSLCHVIVYLPFRCSSALKCCWINSCNRSCMMAENLNRISTSTLPPIPVNVSLVSSEHEARRTAKITWLMRIPHNHCNEQVDYIVEARSHVGSTFSKHKLGQWFVVRMEHFHLEPMHSHNSKCVLLGVVVKTHFNISNTANYAEFLTESNYG